MASGSEQGTYQVLLQSRQSAATKAGSAHTQHTHTDTRVTEYASERVAKERHPLHCKTPKVEVFVGSIHYLRPEAVSNNSHATSYAPLCLPKEERLLEQFQIVRACLGVVGRRLFHR
eukprot:1256673-Amphidinium_carterae.1